MTRRRVALTSEVQATVCAYVRAGGFPHVAAAAAGVPGAVYREWVRRGARPRGGAAYRGFTDAVRQAQAVARLRAETATLTDRPLDWLKCGPGKPTRRRAGWTGPVRPPAPRRRAGTAGPSATLGQFVSTVLEVLAPYPEARAFAAAEFARRSAARHGRVRSGRRGPAPDGRPAAHGNNHDGDRRAD